MKNFTRACFSFFVALTLLCFAALPNNAHATTRTVTSLADDGGAGTLRTLISASVNGDTINFSVTGTITLTNGELAIFHSLAILGPAGGITVSGNNASRVFSIVTNASFPDTTVNVSGLTIANGRVVGADGTLGIPGGNAQGGGILNQGTLSLTNCTITGNSVVGGRGADAAGGHPDGNGGVASGGGVINQNTLTLINCTISGNSVTGGDGGNGTTGSNQGSDGANGGLATGGGIANQNMLTLINCTLNGNSASGGFGGTGGTGSSSPVVGFAGGRGGDGGSGLGGGIANQNAISLINCTISGNSGGGGAGGGGGTGGNGALGGGGGGAGGNGGFASGGGLVATGSSVHNTIIASDSAAGGGAGSAGSGGNGGSSGVQGSVGTSSGPDVFGGVISQGYNLIGRTDGSSGWIVSGANSDLLGGTTENSKLIPLLGPLQNNTGPTPTMALLPMSAAIDAGDDAVTNAPYNLLTDQRGRPRDSGAHVDIGAYEINPFIVTNIADSGPGSLRQGLLTEASGEVILFAPGLSGIITLTSGELLINKDINIVGPGAAILAVSGNTSSRVFNITNVTVNISGLGIRDGFVSGGVVGGGQRGRDNQGGGILNFGVLNLTACEVFNNTAFGGSGGSSSSVNGGQGGSGEGAGVANFNTLLLNSCYVHNNTVVGGHGGNGGAHLPGTGGNGSGGGVYSQSNLLITASTISSNTANVGTHGTGSGGEGLNGIAYGGGLASVAGAISNKISTFANNTADGYGGGVYYSSATFDAVGCTISGNTANLDGNGNGGVGGGIDGVTSVGTVGDTIVAGNNAGVSPDLGGTFTTHGYNFIGIRDGSTGFANGVNHDQAGTQASPIDPLFGPLADNGGPTPTMSLPPGSPAVDKGNSFGFSTDQRDHSRPYDFASVANAGDGSDIGAFELNLPLLNIVRAANNVVLSWSANDTGYTLQAKTNLDPSVIWVTVFPPPVTVSGQNTVTNSAISPAMFYRLEH